MAEGEGGAFQEVDGRRASCLTVVRGKLFVCDHFAEVGDMLLEFGDFFGPGTVRVIGVGDSGGVLAFGFG